MKSNDKLVRASDTPNVDDLTYEYSRSLTDGLALQRTKTAEDVRFARWDSQTSDYKKHASALPEGQQPFPFEGASDTRIRITDHVINTLVSTLMTTFQRAQLKVGGTESNDISSASAMTNLMRWLIGTKLYHEIRREAELLAQHTMTYGWSAMFVGWETKNGLMPVKVTMDEIVAMAGEAEDGSVSSELPEMIMDAAQENAVVDLFMAQIPNVKKRRARKIVKQLREEGEADIPVEYVLKNTPTLVALKPYTEITTPPETTDLQKARVIFRKVYMNEVEIRSKINDEGWDKNWVEQAVSTAGKSMDVNDISNDFSTVPGDHVDRRDNLIEVIYAYSKQLNEDDVPAVYYTIFSPLVTRESKTGKPLFAKHEMLPYNHCQYPFVEFKREQIRRRLTESRSIPELMGSFQSELKAQRDSILDRTSFETLPAIEVNKRLGMANRIGPAVMLPVTKQGDYSFMKPPSTVATTAFTMMELIEKDIHEYFGINHPQIPPETTSLRQQALINNWLTVWTEIYQQMFQLCIQYIGPEEITDITGVEVPLRQDKNLPDFILRFDVADMDRDFMLEKLKIIASQIVPMDVGGSIERNKLIEKLVRGMSPDLADEILTDQKGASQKVFEDVKKEIGGMMLGFEASYTENDPTAGMKMQYAQELIERNPKVKEVAGQDELFSQLIENYMGNLQHSVQQQENSKIGRIGVKNVT
tara:strand:- start:1300 stop:3402 length:2103 start_codon:yes stop_codon:yes gene_type:complete